MSLATALLTPILGDASPWTPRRLFQLGEAGGVYDPSDLTAEKVAWRRNLLTWSEDFTNAAWTKTRSSITPNAGTSWDGTATASKLVEDSSTGTHFIRQDISVTAGIPYAVTMYAKAAERSVLFISPDGGSNFFWFDLSNGTTGGSASGSSAIESVGSGWYRCIYLRTYTTTTTAALFFYVSNSTAGVSYTGDGTSGILVDSAQAQQSPTATAYQRITDFTSDFLAAFPTHGLYQDAAGTTPVTALGQPVGLVIDSKTGGLANVGANTVTGAWENGWTTAFDTFTATASGFTGTTTGAKTNIRVRVPTTLTVGRSYAVEFTVTFNNTTLGSLNFADSGYGGVGQFQATCSALSGLSYRTVGTITATSQSIMLLLSTSAAATVTMTGFAVREVPGVHAIQPTNSSRPLLDGRVNLLTFSEQFDNAAWTLVNPGTRTANTDVAPDGTTTADTLTDNITGNYTGLRQSFSVPNGPQSYLGSLCFKKTTGAASFPGLTLLYSGGTSKASSVAINTDTGVATARTGEVPDSVEVRDAGAYWRVFVTSANNASGNTTLQMDIWAAVNTNGGATWAATTQGSAVIWGADLRLAADAAYPYQRVAAATDYADVGVPRAFAFDGFDDSLYTASNMDLSGTDKVTVLAGVRKLSDAARGIVAELSATTASNNGSFRLAAPEDATFEYSMTSRGTADISAVIDSAVYAAPNTSVITGIGNISGDVVQLRINAAVIATNTTDQGTGNYGSYVLFIGRRNNASLPFSGKAYQLIVRGALTDAATLAQAERYVGAKAGIFL